MTGKRISIFSDGLLAALSTRTVSAQFATAKIALSDATWNGGLTEDCRAVVNHQLSDPAARRLNSLSAWSGYCERLIHRHQLPANTIVHLTGATMRYGSLETRSCSDVQVTVFASAGVLANAVWAGDPAGYCEPVQADFVTLPLGTINVLVFIAACLSPAVLAHVFTVVAEAKASLLAERHVCSCYSTAIATGTGTDTTTVVADPRCRGFSTASTHSQLGMTIAQAARTAIGRALDRESGRRKSAFAS